MTNPWFAIWIGTMIGIVLGELGLMIDENMKGGNKWIK